MSIEYRFIEPLDVLFLRGNQLFGDPGSYGESIIPPRPSVAAGALRSRMLADDRTDLGAFSRNEIDHPTLGTPEHPGSFELAGFYMARRVEGRTEILMPLPADLVVEEEESQGSDNRSRSSLRVGRLSPTAIDLPSSFQLPLLPVLAQEERGKNKGGWWLTQEGWASYLSGEVPTSGQLVNSSELWVQETRIGIGMRSDKRAAEKGNLFSSVAVSLKEAVGFLAAVAGAIPPTEGMLRFGGDGRAAGIEKANVSLPEPDYEAISRAGCCRLVLTSPGLFCEGWRLPGTGSDNRVSLGNVRGRMACACVPRFETISGWDLAKREPKPAQRVVPSGSVYWLDELEAAPGELRKLATSGLWDESCKDDARRAEGFNRVAVAAW